MDTPTHHTEVQTSPVSAPQPYSGQAIASLVLGIFAITSLGLLTGIPALILGIIDVKKHSHNRGMALAGLIMGGIATLLSFLFIAFMIVVIAISASSERNSNYSPYLNNSSSSRT